MSKFLVLALLIQHCMEASITFEIIYSRENIIKGELEVDKLTIKEAFFKISENRNMYGLELLVNNKIARKEDFKKIVKFPLIFIHRNLLRSIEE